MRNESLACSFDVAAHTTNNQYAHTILFDIFEAGFLFLA